MVRGNPGLIHEELPDLGGGGTFDLCKAEFLLFPNVPCSSLPSCVCPMQSLPPVNRSVCFLDVMD